MNRRQSTSSPPLTNYDSDDDMSQDDHQDTWVAYMDGSFTPESPGRGSSAGWGVVIVANGGLPGPTENEGDVVQELYGKVLVN